MVDLQNFAPEMVHIEAGEFWMGASPQDKEAEEAEKPYHKVYLDEYWIGKYPVTENQFIRFLECTGRIAIRKEKPQNTRWRGKAFFPVTGVSWERAMEYCCWLSNETGRHYGLPSEAQWEKAARGVKGQVYPWGNSPPFRDHCNIEGWFNDTTMVGKFSPVGDSPYGCVDMAGNVLEWCADWYQAAYYQVSPERNPPGPEAGECHVVRGGAWCSDRRFARCSYRGKSTASDFYFLVGFRLVCSGAQDK